MTGSTRRVSVSISCLVLLAVMIGGSALLASDAPAPTAAISGRIVSQAKRLDVGARVQLYRFIAPTQRWGWWEPVGEPIVSDKDGSYRFGNLKDDSYQVSVEQPGFAKAFRQMYVWKQESQQADFHLEPPGAVVIHVADEKGRPLKGAVVRGYTLRGANGERWFNQLAMKSLGIPIETSDTSGDIRLQGLPVGDVLRSLTLDRAGYAPVFVSDLTIGSNATGKVTMRPGVEVTFRVPPGSVSSGYLDFMNRDSRSASEILRHEVPFDSQGVGRLTVEKGDYGVLMFQHKNFLFTPTYFGDRFKQRHLRIQPGRNQNLSFGVHRRVKARGRVINTDTGKPVAEASIRGEISHPIPPGWDDQPENGWSFAGWGETNKAGEYSIELAAGLARVSYFGDALVAEQAEYEVQVAADGSTVIPEIRVHAIPKVVGVVLKPDGTPAARMVVRLRGFPPAQSQPVLTDAAGRFEIQPGFIPQNDTGKRIGEQPIAAFDPYSRLAGRSIAPIGKTESITIKLEEHAPEWLFAGFPDIHTDWQRGILSPEEAAKFKPITLLNQTPPELDAAEWINTEGHALRLGGLMGKYVLLDFWYILCGPCHGDFPSMKLAHELFKDRGVVVLGVHDNSANVEAVRAHIEKIGLPFPNAVDQPDGRTFAAYQKHGIAYGVPDHVLISPTGQVLLDDRTIAAPSLRMFKLELLRNYLLKK